MNPVTNTPFDLENVMMHLPEPIYWMDTNGTLLGCNIAEAKLFGLSPHEVIGKTMYDLCELLGWEKKIADELRKNNQKVMATGKPITTEEKMLLSSRKEVIFRTHKAPLFDENKNVIGIIGNSIDITEQIALEKELQRLKTEAQEQSRLSNIYLENILNNLPEPVYWADKNGICLGCNDAEAKLFGLKSAKEVIGKNMDAIGMALGWDEKVAHTIRENDEEVMRTRIPKIMEETAVFPDGKQIVTISHKAPLYDENKNVIGIIGTSIDITERKAAEEREKEALAASTEAHTRAEVETEIREAVSVLAGSMAHDIRSPLATIGLTGGAIQTHFTNLVEGYRLAKEADLPVPAFISNGQIEALRNLGTTFEQVVHDMDAFITTSLKTISRAVTRDLTPDDLLVCSTDKCISNALERYFFAKKPNRELIAWDRKNGFYFMGNDLQFLRVLFNLIQNGLYQIEKNKHGKIFISSENSGDVNILRIKDTAGGASPEIVAQMFKSYHTNKEGGTGVGLAASKLILKSFNAEVTCHSVEGDYMEFVLSFPKVEQVK